MCRGASARYRIENILRLDATEKKATKIKGENQQKVLVSPRIRVKLLAQICQRLGTSLEAGIDARRAWSGEANKGPRGHRRLVSEIRDAVLAGESMADAIARTGGYFPNLFQEMVDVGEQTGNVDQVLLRLAEHYEGEIKLRRTFLAGMAWPLLQLAATTIIIGIFILAMGWVGESTGQTVDFLGWGLVGGRGFSIYVTFVGIVSLGVGIAVYSASRGALWIRPVRYACARLPVLGPVIRTLALSRMAWTLSLTSNTGMEIRRAVELSQKSTRNLFFIRHIPFVDSILRQGEQIHVALRKTESYPAEFLNVIETGEESGRLSESTELLSRQYQERAQSALSILVLLVGFAFWIVVAILAIFLIFRIAISGYLKPIQDALDLLN